MAAGTVSLSGCAPQAEPKTLAAPSPDVFEIIAYRTLTRDDFRGPVADRRLTEASHASLPKCTSIAVAPREVVTRTEATSAGTLYVATLDDPMFYSTFNRGCSWPSPDETHPDADVLEHEQIHFAIAEVEARRMNGRVEAIVARIRSAGTDRDGVTRRAALELQAILKEAEEACVGRDILFDDQVRGDDRVRQRQWFQKISAELHATDMLARGPQTMLPVAVASAPEPVSVPPPAAAPPRKALTPTSAPLAPQLAPQTAPAPPAATAPVPLPAPVPVAPAPAPQTPAPSAPSPPSSPSSPSSGAFPD